VKVQASAPKHGKLSVRTRSGYYPKTDSKTGLADTAAQKTAPAKK
jgi:hypothetical protein